MASPRPLGFKFSWILLILVVVLTVSHYGHADINRKVGILFLSYENVYGTTADGTCCDSGSQQGGGGCVPNICDTAFDFCITHQSNGTTCDPRFETTPIMNNNTVSKFGSNLDENNANGTKSLTVIPVNTMEPLVIRVDVAEVDPPDYRASSGSSTGNLSIVIPDTHLFTFHPNWKTAVLDNGVVRLHLNVTSYCARYYYGSQCDVYCKGADNAAAHYTCDDSGSKICIQGYEDNSTDCVTITDLCVSAPCKNGATCKKFLSGYSCACTAGFTGKNCDNVISPSTTPSPITSPAPSAGQSSTTAVTTTAAQRSTSKSSTSTAATTSTSTQLSTSKTTTTASLAHSTSAAAQRSQQADDSSGGLNIGVVLGPLFGLLAIGAASLLAYLYIRRKKRRNVVPEEEMAEKEQPHTKGKNGDAPKETKQEPQLPQVTTVTPQQPPASTQI